jgi:hypothetical protein
VQRLLIFAGLTVAVPQVTLRTGPMSAIRCTVTSWLVLRGGT